MFCFWGGGGGWIKLKIQLNWSDFFPGMLSGRIDQRYCKSSLNVTKTENLYVYMLSLSVSVSTAFLQYRWSVLPESIPPSTGYRPTLQSYYLHFSVWSHPISQESTYTFIFLHQVQAFWKYECFQQHMTCGRIYCNTLRHNKNLTYQNPSHSTHWIF